VLAGVAQHEAVGGHRAEAYPPPAVGYKAHCRPG
jgi:hypothetical protein